MGSQVFVSYASPDQAKADEIRVALEEAGVSCWIAPRDLHPGTQWGAGIVQAIHGCEAVLVVFSGAANQSPQVAREMELAVANRRPLIPIRVADEMPTDDMQYFLGVSHWFNAYPQPIETYLPEVVAAVRGVLARSRNPWSNFSRRMPKTRNGQILLGLAAVIVAAVIVGLLVRPPNPADAMASPMAGRWEAKVKDASGGEVDCVMDIPKTGTTTFSDTCPSPLTGASGLMIPTKDGTMAPALYRPGDSGTFMFEGFAISNFTGAFKKGFFGGLTTRDERLGEVSWRHASGGAPVQDAAASMLPDPAPWPLTGTPGIVTKANAYIHSKWQADAVLMSVDLKSGGQGGTGGVSASFTYYSPSQQQVVTLMPGSQAGAMSQPTAQQQDVSQAVPAKFIDLPDAIDRAHQAGMQGKDISEAQLEWTGGDSCGTGNFAIDNAILPKCKPGRFIGVQWEIQSALGERLYVPATQESPKSDLDF